MIRLVIADDHAVVRQGLAGLLEGAEDIEVVGAATHGEEAVALVRELDGAGIAVAGIESRRPSLDDVFLGLTGRSLRETGATAEPAEVR